MILIDKALAGRCEQGHPVRVGLIGAGYSGSLIAYQILTAFAGLRLAAICNRTLDKAREAYARAGGADIRSVSSRKELEEAIRANRYAVTDDPAVICEAQGIDAVIEATGTIPHGSEVAIQAIQNGKHLILMNVELDATLGPILKVYADRAGVIYTNSDGDEPGVAMNMLRFVKSIGLKPVVAGNLKGLYDPYRTPETQRGFAEKHRQKPEKMTQFADGTKLFMELTVLANAAGFSAARRGAHGPRLKDVQDSAGFFKDKLVDGGMVDFLVGAAPANGAFVLGYSEDPQKTDYFRYIKMGDGPLYVFYTPFHLPQFEIPLTVARAVLFRDATVAPLGRPFCDAVTVAKRDLKKDERLDGLGGFASYALIENYEVSRKENALPMGLSEGCRLVRDVAKDQLIRYADVRLPAGRFCDRLRQEQDEHFFK